jgi:hypothetical protein
VWSAYFRDSLWNKVCFVCEVLATELKMACATLKRSLDWEPVLGGRPAKRRRCIPFCESPTHRDRASPPASPATSVASSSKPKSAFPDVVSQKLTPGKWTGPAGPPTVSGCWHSIAISWSTPPHRLHRRGPVGWEFFLTRRSSERANLIYANCLSVCCCEFELSDATVTAFEKLRLSAVLSLDFRVFEGTGAKSGRGSIDFKR